MYAKKVGVLYQVASLINQRGRCGAETSSDSSRSDPMVRPHRAERRGAAGSAAPNYGLKRTHLGSAAMPLQVGPSAVCAALLFYSYLLETTLVLGFNLDTKHVIRKDGEPGSFFGFSLAMHRQLNPDKRM